MNAGGKSAVAGGRLNIPAILWDESKKEQRSASPAALDQSS